MLTATSGLATTASAYPMQPAKPQAPQFAPGSVSRTCSTFGSALTTNRAATTAKRHAENNAEHGEHDQARYRWSAERHTPLLQPTRPTPTSRHQLVAEDGQRMGERPVSGYALIVHTWFCTFNECIWNHRSESASNVRRSAILAVFYSVIIPEKPRNARAISPVSTNEMGKPWNDLGTSASSSFSRMLAMMMSARLNPRPEPKAIAMLSNRL